MSEDYDGPEIDASDLEDMQTDTSDLQPEDLFSMVLINKVTKKKVSVELKDAEGATIELKDVVQELLHYIKAKSESSEDNQFMGQIMPLMSQAVVSGLGRMIGLQRTAFYLADETARFSFIHMMAVAFLMLKFVQQKNLVINTYETAVTDDEIEELDRKSKANSTATLGALAGENPQEILKKLCRQGKITDNDLKEMLGETDGSTSPNGAIS